MEHRLLKDAHPESAVEEARLVDAAIAGDSDAFAGLYDRYLGRVYRHVYYRVSNSSDAEDLSQEAFMHAWRAIGRYRRTGAPFLAWLLAIAHNQVIAFYRRARKDRPLDVEPAAPGPLGDPEARLLEEFERSAVRRAILRLKPEHQQVITMRFVEHFEYVDIARALGKTEGNVRVMQHRALQELRRFLTHQVRV